MTAWTRGEAAAIITGSNVLGMAQATNNRATLPALLQAIARPGPIVILPHDNPDPDALASAATLSYLFRELAKRGRLQFVQDAVVAPSQVKAA